MKGIVSGMLAALLALLCACGPPAEVSAAPAASPAEASAAPAAAPYTLTELALPLRLDEGEMALLEDARGELLLINVCKKMTPDDPLKREEGYLYRTRRLEVLDRASGETLLSLAFEGPAFCPGAVLCESGILFLEHTITGTGLGPYAVRYRTWGQYGAEATLLQGEALDFAGAGPELAGLGDGYAACSFYDRDAGEFGVRVLTPAGEVRDCVVLREAENAAFQGARLRAYGDRCLFFAAVDERAYVFVCGRDGPVGSIPLGENERIYDFCFLGGAGSVLLSLEDLDAPTRESRRYVLRDLEGGTLLRTPGSWGAHSLLARAVSNGTTAAVGIDGSFRAQLLLLRDGVLSVESLGGLTGSARFFCLSEREFLAAFSPAGQVGAPTLYRIELAAGEES